LRDRIRQTGVRISIVDRLARKQYAVEPHQFQSSPIFSRPRVLAGSSPSSSRIRLVKGGAHPLSVLIGSILLCGPKRTYCSVGRSVSAPL
jgi:hypothetical protein